MTKNTLIEQLREIDNELDHLAAHAPATTTTDDHIRLLWARRETVVTAITFDEPPFTPRRPTYDEACEQTYELLTRFDNSDFPPCCANCGDPIDYQTTNMLCADCALDTYEATIDDMAWEE